MSIKSTQIPLRIRPMGSPESPEMPTSVDLSRHAPSASKGNFSNAKSEVTLISAESSVI